MRFHERSGMLAWNLICAVWIAWAGVAYCGAKEPAAGPAQVVLLSDLHLDPLADPALVDRLVQAPAEKWREIFLSSKQTGFAAYKSDSNFPLFESAIQAAAKNAPHAALVLISGDLLVHKFEPHFDALVKNATHAQFEDFVGKTIRFEAQEFRDAFHGVQVVPALGNNDSPCGDYATQPGSPFIRAFAEDWKDLVQTSDPAAFVGQTAKGGYYSVLTKMNPKLRVIVLNGTYWSRKYENRCGAPASDGKAPDSAAAGTDELAWLKMELEAARTKGEQVWLLNHIPAGIDGYKSIRDATDLCTVKGTAFYQDASDEALLAMIHDFNREIRLSVTGHTHMNDFRLLGGDRDDAVVNLIVPSVSPIQGNNPSFTVVKVDPSRTAILDSEVFTLSDAPDGVAAKQAAWKKEYSFNAAYHLRGIATATLRSLAAKLREPGPERQSFIRYFQGSVAKPGLDEKYWLGYWCAIEHQDVAGYQNCVCPAHAH